MVPAEEGRTTIERGRHRAGRAGTRAWVEPLPAGPATHRPLTAGRKDPAPHVHRTIPVRTRPAMDETAVLRYSAEVLDGLAVAVLDWRPPSRLRRALWACRAALDVRRSRLVRHGHRLFWPSPRSLGGAWRLLYLALHTALFAAAMLTPVGFVLAYVTGDARLMWVSSAVALILLATLVPLDPPGGER